MPRIGNGQQNPFSDEQLSAAYTKIVRYYLRKNADFIQNAWTDIIRTRVYGGNTPVCYLRTEALLKGFDVNQFIKSFKIVVDNTGFNVNLDYTFDSNGKTGNRSPVMREHLKKRGSTPIDKIMVEVHNSTGQTQSVSLPLFMKTHRFRVGTDWEPKIMSKAVLMDKLVGSFRPPKDNTSSYFAAYFTAGPNSKGNPEVYKRGGANPKGTPTKRDSDKSTIITDFLAKLGLNPTRNSKPSSGKSDWIILVDTFSEQANVGYLPAPTPTQCEVGGILQACLRTYELIQRARPIFKKKKWHYQGQLKSATRVADAVRETRAFRRWQDAFYGAKSKELRAQRRDEEHRMLHGATLETELDPTKVQEATEFVQELHQKGVLEGLSGSDLTQEIISLVPKDMQEAVRTVIDRAHMLRTSESATISEADAAVAELSADLAEGEKFTGQTRRDFAREATADAQDRIQNAFLHALEGGGELPWKEGAMLANAIEEHPEMSVGLKIRYIPPSNPGASEADGTWELEIVGGGVE